MIHWYFEEITMIQRMREVQREADRAQALGVGRRARPLRRPRLRAYLGQRLVALGQRLQQSEQGGRRRTDLASTSQCGNR